MGDEVRRSGQEKSEPGEETQENGDAVTRSGEPSYSDDMDSRSGEVQRSGEFSEVLCVRRELAYETLFTDGSWRRVCAFFEWARCMS